MSPRKSTIVRSLASTGLKTAFGATERLAPALGARWATRLWLTVPRFRGKPGKVQPGTAFTIDGVTGTVWGDGPVVYLVHGWGGARTQLYGFVAPLVEAGYRVVAYDALSHGDSKAGFLGPRQTTIPEMADSLMTVVGEYGTPHAVVAHSAGASAVFFALRGGLRAERLVFLAPMTQPEAMTAWFADGLGIGEKVLTGMRARIAEVANTPWDDFDMPVMARRIAVPPLFITHDLDDRKIACTHSTALAEAWPDRELVTTRGLGHWRILKDPATITRAVEFLSHQPVQAGGVPAADAER